MSGFDPVEEIVALRVAVQILGKSVQIYPGATDDLDNVVLGELRALNLGNPSGRAAAVATQVRQLLSLP